MMKKILLCMMTVWLMLIGMLIGNNTYGQTRGVAIGDGIGKQYELPFNNYYHYSYNEMIYLQEEIGEEGYIGAIAYEKDGNRGITFDDLTIWMANTSDSIIVGNNGWIDSSSLKQVFHKTDFTIMYDEQKIMIVLDTAFYYNGTGNLAICIAKKSNDISSGIKFHYHNTDRTRCIYRQSDNNANYSKHPGTLSGMPTNQRPNIKLMMSDTETFCFPVTYLTTTSTTEHSISIEWPMSEASSTYRVAILDTAISSNLDDAETNLVSVNRYTFNSLQPNTNYIVGVRKECGDNSYSPWETRYVNTTQTATNLPFYCDFESEEARSHWLLDNGNLTNHWTMGTATAYGENSLNSLYITNGTAHEYNNRAQGIVYAKTLLHFDHAGEYNIGFDWIGYGESTYDYLRVMMVPAYLNETITASDVLPNGITSTRLPEDIIAADGGERKNISPSWQTFDNVFILPEMGDYYLVFAWRNDGNSGNNPPAGVDNITVEEAVCPGVDEVYVSDVTTTGVTINATSASGNNFMFCYRLSGSDDTYDTLEISSPYRLDGLPTGAYFEAEICSSCGSYGYSFRTTKFTFQTECTEVTLPWIFNAEGNFMQHSSGEEEFPYCWENLNANHDSHFWQSRTEEYAHWGEHGLYFNGRNHPDTIHNDWLFLPAMTFTGNEEIDMWIRAHSNYEGNNCARFELYVSTDGLNSITDTAHYEIVPLTGEYITNNRIIFTGIEWKKITLQLPNTIVGERHLALVVNNFNTNTFGIDDIYIHEKNSYEMPYDTRLTEITSTTATAAWSSNANSFVVYYGAPGFSIDTANSISTTDHMVDITGLNPNTSYEFKVVALFGEGEQSIASYPQPFKTTNVPYAEINLPYIEGFEDNRSGDNEPLDDGWIKGNNNTSMDYPYVTAHEWYHTINSLEFYANSYNYSYVALPAFESEVSDLVLSCSLFRNGYTDVTGALIVGLISNPYDISTFTPYDTLVPTVADTWNDFKISLTNFNSDYGHYIAFVMPADRYNEVYLDDLKIELRGECDMPANVRVTNLTATTATITWIDSTANNWTIYYGEPGFEIDTVSYPIIASNEAMATITELNPTTEYEVSVVATCNGDGYSLEGLRSRFTTACNAIANLPYQENFESYETGEDANIDPCWTKGSIGEFDTEYPYPSSNAAIQGGKGLHLSAEISQWQNYYSYVTLPLFEEDINNLQIKFDVKNKFGIRTDYNYHSIVVVGIMGNPKDMNTFDTIEVIDMQNIASGTVQSHEIPLNTYTGTGQYITFIAPKVNRGAKANGENTIYLDNIKVELAPACPRPTHVSATSSAHTIDLSWEGSASAYEIIYSSHANMRDRDTLTCQGNTMTIDNLNSYTYYYINVRGVCSNNERSPWMVYPMRVRTTIDCGTGYINDIDTLGRGDDVSYELVVNGGSSNLNCCNWMIFESNELNNTNIEGGSSIIHSISVETTKSGSNLPLRIYMAETSLNEFSTNMSDTMPLNQMTLVFDGTMNVKNNSWNEVILDTPYQHLNSENLMIAFERNEEVEFTSRFCYSWVRKYKTAYRYDNGNVRYGGADRNRGNMIFNMCRDTADCILPYHVTAVNITADSITLSWNGMAEHYKIIYGTTAFDPNNITDQTTITTTERHIKLRNLTEHTTYYIYVCSVCPDNSMLWENPIIVTTPCNAIDLPYSENFDSYIAGEQAAFDNCWYKGTNCPETDYPFVQSEVSYSAPNSMKFYAAPQYYSYATLPLFTTPITAITLRFKLHAQGYQSAMRIGVMSDPKDINSFEQIAEVSPTTMGVWEDFEIIMNNYQGDGRYIAFMLPNRTFAFMALDNLEVYENSSCATPHNITIPAEQITETSALIQWECLSETTNGFEIEYGPTGFMLGEGTQITTDLESVTLNGLEAMTEYDVYVRTICNETEYSRWSIKATFTTKEPCDVPRITATTTDTHSATITWIGNADQYQLMIKKSHENVWEDTISVTDNHYTFENLNAQTTYEVRIRSLCDINNHSEWVNNSFTTRSMQGIENIEGTFSFNIYPNPTSNTTTISVKGIEGKVAVKIIDINGHIVKTETISCSMKCGKRMEVEHLAQGTYFVQVIGEEIYGIQKLIVR